MGWKNEKGEHLEWAFQTTEETFIEIIYNRVKKKQESSFKREIWEDINDELKNITGLNFGVDKLKQKFNRLRDEFKVGYWCDLKYNSKGKLPKKIIEYGLKHDYDMHMLGEIFKELDHAAAQDPPAVDVLQTAIEEVHHGSQVVHIDPDPIDVLQRAVEEGHVPKVVHIDPDDPIGVYGDLKEFDKKRKNVVSSSEYQHKEAKKSRSRKFEESLSNSIESINGKTKASKVKADRYKTEADSPITDPYSIEACMELLDSMDDIPSKFYNNALVKFKDKDWRLMFIKMPFFRRKDWLASLE